MCCVVRCAQTFWTWPKVIVYKKKVPYNESELLGRLRLLLRSVCVTWAQHLCLSAPKTHTCLRIDLWCVAGSVLMPSSGCPYQAFCRWTLSATAQLFWLTTFHGFWPYCITCKIKEHPTKKLDNKSKDLWLELLANVTLWEGAGISELENCCPLCIPPTKKRDIPGISSPRNKVFDKIHIYWIICKTSPTCIVLQTAQTRTILLIWGQETKHTLALHVLHTSQHRLDAVQTHFQAEDICEQVVTNPFTWHDLVRVLFIVINHQTL